MIDLSQNPYGRVRSDYLCAKLGRLEERPDWCAILGRFPRIKEALCFVWRKSREPGGLPALADQIRKKCADSFQPPAMRKLGPPAGGHYNAAECAQIWRELYKACPTGRRECMDINGDPVDPDPESLDDFINFRFDPRQDPAAYSRADVQRFNYQALERFAQARTSRMEDWLFDLCEFAAFSGSIVEQEESPSSFRRDFTHALLLFMDEHAQEELGRFVETSLSRRVFRELDCVRITGDPCQFLGETRLGKTFSFEGMERIWPGRYWRHEVEPGNGVRDLVFGMARDLGYEAGVSLERAKANVLSFLKRSGLVVLFDEAHRLFPATFSKDTAPTRLEWVRHLCDQGVRCAFMATVQNYTNSKDRFLKKTKFAIEQWDARVGEPIILDTIPESGEIRAAVGSLLPGQPADVIAEISLLCRTSQKYFSVMRGLCSRALFEAQDAGREIITSADINAAKRRFCPTFAEPEKPVCKATAGQVPARRNLAPSGRRQEALAAV
jgi:hypothetical protein